MKNLMKIAAMVALIAGLASCASKGSVSQLEMRLGELESANEKRQKDLSKAQSDLDQKLTGGVEELRTRLTALETSRSQQLAQTSRQIEDRLNTTSQELNALIDSELAAFRSATDTEVGRAQRELAAKISSVETYARAIDNLQTDMKSTKDLSQSNQQKIAELNTDLDTERGQRQKRDTELKGEFEETMNVTNRRVNDNHTLLRRQHDTLADSFKKFTTAVQELTSLQRTSFEESMKQYTTARAEAQAALQMAGSGTADLPKPAAESGNPQ